VNVDHLAARYIAFVPGGAAATDLCHAGTLALSVSIPSGTGAEPAVFVTGSTAAQLLSISGSTASVTLPWSDCTGGPIAYLSLPNASASTNGAEFVVSATLTIDPNTITTAVAAPLPVSMPGVVLAAPTTPITPTIQLWGPEVVHVSSTEKLLRLIVTSDTNGTVQGTLGSYALGTAAIRAGGNDLRFPLPPAALRRTAASSGLITLTPLSSGGLPGTAVTRLLAIDYLQPKATSKPKAKPKVKHGVQPHRHSKHKG
jgi:hypothetical protein